MAGGLTAYFCVYLYIIKVERAGEISCELAPPKNFKIALRVSRLVTAMPFGKFIYPVKK